MAVGCVGGNVCGEIIYKKLFEKKARRFAFFTIHNISLMMMYNHIKQSSKSSSYMNKRRQQQQQWKSIQNKSEAFLKMFEKRLISRDTIYIADIQRSMKRIQVEQFHFGMMQISFAF